MFTHINIQVFLHFNFFFQLISIKEMFTHAISRIGHFNQHWPHYCLHCPVRAAVGQ